MCINELIILAVVFHTRANAAPHSLVWGGIVAVMARTCGREIHVAAVSGVLGGEDMIERCEFVEVGVASLGVAAVEVFGEFEHIVGIATFGAVDVVDEIGARLTTREVFAATVATEGE